MKNLFIYSKLLTTGGLQALQPVVVVTSLSWQNEAGKFTMIIQKQYMSPWIHSIV